MRFVKAQLRSTISDGPHLRIQSSIISYIVAVFVLLSSALCVLPVRALHRDRPVFYLRSRREAREQLTSINCAIWMCVCIQSPRRVRVTGRPKVAMLMGR